MSFYTSAWGISEMSSSALAPLFSSLELRPFNRLKFRQIFSLWPDSRYPSRDKNIFTAKEGQDCNQKMPCVLAKLSHVVY